MNDVRPAIRSGMGLSLYGTCVASKPARMRKRSAWRCGELPAPGGRECEHAGL